MLIGDHHTSDQINNIGWRKKRRMLLTLRLFYSKISRKIAKIVVIIFSFIREKTTHIDDVWWEQDWLTDGRAYKLLRLPIFFCFFISYRPSCFFFFPLLFLSLLPFFSSSYAKKKRNETNINVLSTNRRKLADVWSKAIGWFRLIFFSRMKKDGKNTSNMSK